MAKKMLVEADKFLKTGCHIGTKFKTAEMRKYIYKQRTDGLKVLDVQTLNERIEMAAEMLSRYPREGIAVVSRKLYGREAVKAFSEATGARAFTGRFVPGTFTNPEGKEFFEPSVVLVTEPEADWQAISEAKKVNAVVIALCSTNNSTKDIDFVVPVNNKGRKSLALVYWLITRELMKNRGEIKRDSDFKKNIEEFEYQVQEGEEGETVTGKEREGKTGVRKWRGKQ